MGSLILLLLVIDRRAKVVMRAKALAAIRQMDAETENEAAKRTAEWERRREALHAHLQQQTHEVKVETGALEKRMAAALRDLESEQTHGSQLDQQLQAEQATLFQQEKRIASKLQATVQKKQESEATQAELARLTSEFMKLEQTVGDLKALRQKQKQTYSLVPYRGRRGDNRRPIYVECAASSLIFHPDHWTLPATDSGGSAILQEVERRIRRQQTQGDPDASKQETPYLLLLVRPDGIMTYYRTLQALRGLQIDFGYEFVESDWVLRFPENESDAAPQPWMSAGLPPENSNAPPTLPSARPAANNMANGGVARGGMANGGMLSGSIMNEGMTSGTSHGPNNPPTGVSDGPVNSPTGGFGPRVSTSGTGFGNAPGAASDRSGGFPGGSSQNAGHQYPIGPPTGELQSGVGSASTNPLSGHLASNGPITQSGDNTSGINHLGAAQTGINGAGAGTGVLSNRQGNGPGSGGFASDSGKLTQEIAKPPGPIANEQTSTLPYSRDGTAERAGSADGNIFAKNTADSGTAKSGALTPVPSPSTSTGGANSANRGQGNSTYSPTAPSLIPNVSPPAGASRVATVQQGATESPEAGSEPAGAPVPGSGLSQLGASQEKRPRPASPVHRFVRRDWNIFIECSADQVVIYPGESKIPMSSLGGGSRGNQPVLQAVQQMMARRQAVMASADASKDAASPQIRFLVRPDGLRAYFLAYPELASLQLPMTRENLDANEDVMHHMVGR
jgi:hypothetical protein